MVCCSWTTYLEQQSARHEFRRQLKTLIIFQTDCGASWRLWLLRLANTFTYLLTYLHTHRPKHRGVYPPKTSGAIPPNRRSGGRKSPSGVHPGGGLGAKPQKPENKRRMAFKKTICEDIWLVFMTINAQVCYSCALFKFNKNSILLVIGLHDMWRLTAATL